MASLPLLAAPTPDTPMAYRGGRAIGAGRLLAAARALATRLPAGGPVINLCNDRLCFTVGVMAALVAGRTSLLPASTAIRALAPLRESAPDVVSLDDELARSAIDAGEEPAADFDVPTMDADAEAAWIYTSGSTGAPVAHRKRWGTLVRCLRAGAARLGIDAGGWSLVATVPPQHMYGFELSVLMPWLSGNAVATERPLLAPEVAATLASVPRPRALVTTPLHLRALLASSTTFPAVDLLVSATSPLTAALARDSEQRFGAPLREIYGSTETGEMALRRTAQEQLWELWPGLRLEREGDGHTVQGGHLDARVMLHDVVEPVGSRHFLLQGRRTDLVDVGGRRSSLGYLNHQLQSVPGVIDGAFIRREQGIGATGATRLAALVVAPTLSVAQVMEALRSRIDPAFLPRPLLRVDALPRNATGKLPLEAALDLLARGDPAQGCPA